MNRDYIRLEPEQLDLLKTLASANETVPAEERKAIRGRAGDNRLLFFHSSFPNGQLQPNRFDLDALQSAGLIRAYEQGGRKGWKIDILPEAQQYLESLGKRQGNRSFDEPPTFQSSTRPSSQQKSEDPKTEALEVLEKLIEDVEQNAPTLESLLRRCARASHLIRHPDYAEIFSKDVRGYPPSDVPPHYRRISGVILWKTVGFKQLNDPNDVGSAIAARKYGNQACEMAVAVGIERIRDAAINGYVQPSQSVQPQQVIVFGSTVWVEAVEYYAPMTFQGLLRTIEQMAYDWALQWSVYLRYESRVTNIWERYRSSVDAKLEEISLKNHLTSIDQNLASANEQDWRNVLYGCRSMLQDVANYLWKDDRESYEPIQVRDEDGQRRGMRVTHSHYVNRLQAYLHQKSARGDHTDLLEKEAEYLGALLLRLNRVDNQAHAGATREIAESAAIHTYVLLAELVRRTDMQPIEQYQA